MNRDRIKTKEVRIGILDDEWETYKNEISKALLAIKKPKDAAKKAAKLQQKLFQIPIDIRDKYFNLYYNYCKDIYIIKCLHWRNQKLRYLQLKEVDAIWEAEIPRLYDKIKADRKNLFEELDVFSQDTLLTEKSPLPNLDLSKVSA
jgi:hypothetical protein